MGQAVLPALLSFRKRPPLAAGVVVAVLCVTAETVAAGFLPRTPGAYPVSVVYLGGLVVVAALWGLWLGLATAVAGVVALELFVATAAGRVRPSGAEFLASLVTFVLVTLLAAGLSGLARRLRAEADARAEADLTAELSRLLLCAPDPRTALPAASPRCSRSRRPPSSGGRSPATNGTWRCRWAVTACRPRSWCRPGCPGPCCGGCASGCCPG
jgi:K+-sensing histidine kinase KdpD